MPLAWVGQERASFPSRKLFFTFQRQEANEPTRGAACQHIDQSFPAKAIELVDVAGLQDAPVLLADFAAAGLIKTYALVRETSSADASVEAVREAQIPAEALQRIVTEKKIADAFNGGDSSLARFGAPGRTALGADPRQQLLGSVFG